MKHPRVRLTQVREVTSLRNAAARISENDIPQSRYDEFRTKGRRNFRIKVRREFEMRQGQADIVRRRHCPVMLIQQHRVGPAAQQRYFPGSCETGRFGFRKLDYIPLHGAVSAIDATARARRKTR